MPRIINEPFAPRRRHLMINYRREFSRVSPLSCGLKRSSIASPKLDASSEDICMIVLLITLLVTTLFLPWIVL